MIRRCLCALLTLCLLLSAVPALAEGFALECYWEAEEAGVRAFLAQRGYEGDTLNQLTIAATALMNSLALQGQFQEDACYLSVWLEDEPVIQAGVEQVGDSVELRCSLLPGVVLCANQAAAETQPLSLEAWEAMAAEMEGLLYSWVLGLPSEEFESAPDAADGIANTTSWYFSDEEVAVLVDALLTAAAPSLEAMGETGSELTETIRTLNEEARSRNEYEYQLTLDTSAEGDLLGVALVSWRGMDPVSSLLLEPLPDLGDAWYLETSIGVNGVVHEQYTVIQTLDNEEAQEHYIDLFSTGDFTFETWCYWSEATGEAGLQTEVYLSDEDDTVAWSYYMDWFPVDDIPRLKAEEEHTLSMDESGELSEDDMSMLYAALEEGSADLMKAMFRKLPAELLVLLMNVDF